MTAHHDPGSGVSLVPCDCGDDCEWLDTDCCGIAQRECETTWSPVYIAGELEDAFRHCKEGFGCYLEAEYRERTR